MSRAACGGPRSPDDPSLYLSQGAQNITAQLAADIARIPRLTADELRLETGLAELAIAAGTADPDDVTYRAALEKHLA